MSIQRVILLLIVVILSACKIQDNRPMLATKEAERPTMMPCPDIVDIPDNMPLFLEWVYPTGTISKAEYDESVNDGEGIKATISALGLDESIADSTDGTERGEKIQNRVQLLIDGQVQESPTNLGDGLMPLGPFYFDWAIELDIGYYQAKLIFDIDTDVTVAYEWSFCISS